jgi:DNA (cytosine-5)-methyltransferase 1
MPTCLELCAGMGAMGLGFERAGFQHVALVELDPRCIETMKANGFAHVHQASIETFDFSRFHGVDVVSGGCPCTPFSIAGKHGGSSDSRNLWPHMVRAVAETQPRAFLFENASAMSSKHATYLAQIIQELSALGYNVTQYVIDAVNYGVPMHRKRTLLVGVRNGTYTPPPTSPHTTVRAALAHLGPPTGTNGHAAHTFLPKVYNGHSGSVLDRPSKSLVSGSRGVGGGNNCITLDDGTIRYFTPREAATLMGIPQTFHLPSRFSLAHKQIGNAAPVELIRRFAEQLVGHLQDPNP